MTRDNFAFEEPIRDLAAMAEIASGLALTLIGQDFEEKDGDRLIRLSPREPDRLLFAISHVADMAEELNTKYLGAERAGEGAEA